jgi:hypothetical protein
LIDYVKLSLATIEQCDSEEILLKNRNSSSIPR